MLTPHAARGADRRADRPRQPPRADQRPRARCWRGRGARRPARARALRPRRLQALQRQLRPSGGRRPARPPGRATSRRRVAEPRPRLPDGRRRVLRAAAPAPGPARAGRGARRRGAERARRGLRHRLARTASSSLPREADDAAEALRIADQRMYAQKHGGRAVGGHARAATCSCARWPSATRSSASTSTTVAELAVAVARRLGLTPAEVEQVRHAADLHDVGKVAIPDAILNKPGPLDDDEWAFMRRHTIIGERIVAAAPALARRRGPRARQPRALRRRRLPGRPRRRGDPARRAHRRGLRLVRRDGHRPPVPQGAARRRSRCEELERCAGTQFDPAVVAAFREAYAELAQADALPRAA